MQEIVEFIKVVGFPAFVCAWFMLRNDKKMDRQAEISENILITLESLKKESKDGD